MTAAVLAELPAGTRRLLAARAVRSIGQGILVTDFALYLHALGWPAHRIGALFAASLGVGVVLTLVLGPLGDRRGRRRFLLFYQVLLALTAAVALATARPAWLSVAAVLGGFGRGESGAPGPFMPLEQAWLADGLSPQQRGPVYSLNTALGFFGMALGALVGALPDLHPPGLAGALAYRPLFAVVLLGALGSAALLRRTPEHYRPVPHHARRDPADADVRRRENRALGHLMLVNAFNGMGIGLVGPLMTYWFALRFGAGPGRIAPAMALAFVLSGLTSLATGRLTRRLGLVASVVRLRSAGLLLLVLMPLMPSFPLAAALFILRSAFNRGTAGARQALNMGLVRPMRRGLVASLGSASLQIPRAIGPLAAGLMFGAGWLTAPFLLAASFQGGYLYLYHRLFRQHDPHRQPAAPASSGSPDPRNPEAPGPVESRGVGKNAPDRRATGI